MFNLLKSFVQFLAGFAKFVSDKQLIDAGKAKSNYKQFKAVHKSVEKTKSIRNRNKPNHEFLRPPAE